MVIAAQHCTQDAARRADSIAQDLAKMGLPVIRHHAVQCSFSSLADTVAQQFTSAMEGPMPIVFVRGRAMSDPTLDEIVAEFNASRS